MTPPVRHLDGVIRKGIEEAIRFLRSGAVYPCSVDDHHVVIIRLESPASDPRFFVACADCLRVISRADEGEPLRRVYLEIHKHTELPCQTR